MMLISFLGLKAEMKTNQMIRITSYSDNGSCQDRIAIPWGPLIAIYCQRKRYIITRKEGTRIPQE
jgi:hypothetical protein